LDFLDDLMNDVITTLEPDVKSETPAVAFVDIYKKAKNAKKLINEARHKGVPVSTMETQQIRDAVADVYFQIFRLRDKLEKEEEKKKQNENNG